MICELNAPARPRSPVTSSSPTRVALLVLVEDRQRSGTLPAASAAWRVMRRIASAYGRRCAMRCSARRRRAAATISIARVIFWMFLTRRDAVLDVALGLARAERLLLLARAAGAAPPSLVVGLAAAVRRRALGAAPPRASALRSASLVVERLALLVEVVAEVVGELADTRSSTASWVSSDQSPPAIFSQQVGALGAQALGQAVEELGDPVDA